METIWSKMVKCLSALIGAVMGWWTGLGVMPQVLAAVMVMDYATGLMCAWRGVSPKTEGGGVSSRAGFDGLLKKAAIILVCLLAALLDRAVGTSVIAPAAMCFYMANEGVSILENTSLLGVPYPQAVRSALEALKEKGEGEKEETEEE